MISVRRGESGGPPALQFEGALTLAESPALWAMLLRETASAQSGESLDFDLSRIQTTDGAAMAILTHVRGLLSSRGVTGEIVGANASVDAVARLYRGAAPDARSVARPAPGILSDVGLAAIAFMREVQVVLGFVGETSLAVVGLARHPRSGNWGNVAHLVERTGADAVGIVVLINFLIGFVMAFQGSVQLKQFGANLYVADLVGLSVTRELGPLMTAIIVCGRSGAAFAAEIGSMKVSEEIDALKTMGFGPMRYLVVPRAVALVMVMPILTLLADAVGMLGGLVVGVASLDLTATGYWIETCKVVRLWDVTSGVVKSVVFAMVIAMVSCQQGFAASGGAEGVGRRTTSAVVSTLFALILVDATFTVIFHAFDL